VTYLPVALRRVYGGSRRAAWVKSLVLMSVHRLVILALVVARKASRSSGTADSPAVCIT